MSETVSDPVAATSSTPAPALDDGLGEQPRRIDPPADRFMRRLLCLPVDGPPASKAAARKAFQTSIVVTAFRCVIMYLVLPFVLPAIGIATDAAPAVILPVNLIAMAMIVMSMRRFWRADHPKRWWYTALGSCVIAFLLYFTIADTVNVLT